MYHDGSIFVSRKRNVSVAPLSEGAAQIVSRRLTADHTSSKDESSWSLGRRYGVGARNEQSILTLVERKIGFVVFSRGIRKTSDLVDHST